MLYWKRRIYVRVSQGAKGKWRWVATLDGQVVAICNVSGYETEVEARQMANIVLRGYKITWL